MSSCARLTTTRCGRLLRRQMASPIESSIVAGSRCSRLHPLAIARREAAQKQFCRQLVDMAVCDTVWRKSSFATTATSTDVPIDVDVNCSAPTSVLARCSAAHGPRGAAAASRWSSIEVVDVTAYARTVIGQNLTSSDGRSARSCARCSSATRPTPRRRAAARRWPARAGGPCCLQVEQVVRAHVRAEKRKRRSRPRRRGRRI
jgi:hypothetical protein